MPKMRAVQVSRAGGPFEIVEREIPQPGPREVREGVVGFLLKSVALISLVAGPIALLILFQLQFLAYHSPWITWWQRVAVVLDLVLLWLLWPPIARGDTALLTWNDLRRGRVAAWLPVSLLPLLLVVQGRMVEGPIPVRDKHTHVIPRCKLNPFT